MTEAEARGLLDTAWRYLRDFICEKPCEVSYQTRYEALQNITPEVVDALTDDSLKGLARGIMALYKENLSCFVSPIPIEDWMLKETELPKPKKAMLATRNDVADKVKTSVSNLSGCIASGKDCIRYEARIARELFPMGDTRVSALVKTNNPSDEFHIYRIEWHEPTDGGVVLVCVEEFNLSDGFWHSLVHAPFLDDDMAKTLLRSSKDGANLIGYIVEQMSQWFKK